MKNQQPSLINHRPVMEGMQATWEFERRSGSDRRSDHTKNTYYVWDRRCKERRDSLNQDQGLLGFPIV